MLFSIQIGEQQDLPLPVTGKTSTIGDMTVMTISKELLNWTDTYSLQYSNPADEIPGLLLVIAIDAVTCDRNK